MLRSFLERDGSDFSTPFDVFRTMYADEAGQRMDCGKSLVPGGDATAASFFKIQKEKPHELGRDIDDRESLDLSAGSFSDARDQQRERVAVTPLGVVRQVALAHCILKKETSYPWS